MESTTRKDNQSGRDARAPSNDQGGISCTGGYNLPLQRRVVDTGSQGGISCAGGYNPPLQWRGVDTGNQGHCRLTTMRNERGMSLVEMLVTAGLIAFISAGIAGAVILNGMSMNKLSNKVDNLNAARQAIERIGKDVRQARNIGDVFGNLVMVQQSPMVMGTIGSNTFPSNQNSLYGGGQAPPGGWPASPWPGRPYTLSPQTLIVQVPVFDANGWPTGIPQGFGSPAAPSPQDNVDTLVYQVLPDPEASGEYMLQVAGFRGLNSTLSLPGNPPATLLKGIIGPIDPGTGQISVFKYLDKTDGSGTPLDTGPNGGANNANLTGVLVNFEIRTNTQNTTTPAVVGIKTEVYMRNNALSTVNANI